MANLNEDAVLNGIRKIRALANLLVMVSEYGEICEVGSIILDILQDMEKGG